MTDADLSTIEAFAASRNSGRMDVDDWLLHLCREVRSSRTPTTPVQAIAASRGPTTLETFYARVNAHLLRPWGHVELGTGPGGCPAGRSIPVPPELFSDVGRIIVAYQRAGWCVAPEGWGAAQQVLRFYLTEPEVTL